jgi:hypothetical protein
VPFVQPAEHKHLVKKKKTTSHFKPEDMVYAEQVKNPQSLLSC